jgi:hypothetical protein
MRGRCRRAPFHEQRQLVENSPIALEGVVRFLMTLPREELERCTFGC